MASLTTGEKGDGESRSRSSTVQLLDEPLEEGTGMVLAFFGCSYLSLINKYGHK